MDRTVKTFCHIWLKNWHLKSLKASGIHINVKFCYTKSTLSDNIGHNRNLDQKVKTFCHLVKNWLSKSLKGAGVHIYFKFAILNLFFLWIPGINRIEIDFGRKCKDRNVKTFCHNWLKIGNHICD